MFSGSLLDKHHKNQCFVDNVYILRKCHVLKASASLKFETITNVVKVLGKHCLNVSIYRNHS